jgi:beta-lactamase regulating signal transducer with metallopeptidase domain
MTELHTILIYGFVGYLLIYPAALLAIKIFAVGNPNQRKQLYLAALLMPLIGFILYHTFLTKRCEAYTHSVGMSQQLFDTLCFLGNRLLYIIGPLLGAVVILGIVKAVTAAILIQRLRKQAAVSPVAGQVDALITRLCADLHIAVPEVIFTGRPGFAAFTAGILKPVLVLNSSLVGSLAEDDLEAVLAHELVHVKQRDTMKNWLIHLARDIMFFNPLSSYLLNRCLLENERVCDRESIRLTGRTRLAYASTLLRVWRLILDQPSLKPDFCSAFTGRKNEMEQRITSLAQEPEEERKLPSLLFLGLIAAFGTGSMLFLGLIC